MVRLAAPLRPLWPALKAGYTRGTRLVAPVSVRLSQLRGGHLPTGEVATLEDAAGSSHCATVVAEEVVERPEPVGHPVDHPSFVAARREVLPRVAVAALRNARVLGPPPAVITAGGDLVFEVSRYFNTTLPREHPIFLHPFPLPPVDVAGTVGLLAARGDGNYYHFLMDVLPRIELIERCPELQPPTRWYVPASTGFQRELLDLLGVTPAMRIDSTEVPHLRAETLVVSTIPSSFERELKNPGWVVAYLRRRLIGANPPTRVVGRNVYVTRGSARRNRVVVDEDTVLDALSPWGFTRIDPGSMTVRDQISAFAEADVIVAPHGAALANLVFASPGATVIEMFPAGHMVPHYWKLACAVPGLNYRYLAGLGWTERCDPSRMLVTDIDVDLPRLRAMLDEISAQRGSRVGGHAEPEAPGPLA